MSRLVQKRKQHKSKALDRDITSNECLLVDIKKWTTFFIEYIEQKINNDEMSPRTLRSYQFFVKALLIFTKREFNIDDGIDTLDETFINEFLDWVSRYSYSVKYGSDEYVFDSLLEFINYVKKNRDAEVLDSLNQYIKKIEKEEYVTDEHLAMYDEFIDYVEHTLCQNLSKCKERDIDSFVEHIKEQEESKYSVVAKKVTMKQRKGVFTSFLTFISSNNNQKHNFQPLYKYINTYTIKNMVHKKRSYTEEDGDIRIIDSMFRKHISFAKDDEETNPLKVFTATRDSLLALIMYYGGLRSSEALSLSFGDVVDNGDDTYIVTVRNGKGRKSRQVPIFKPLIEKELNALKDYGLELIGSTHVGHKMDYGALFRSIRSIFDRNGIEFKGLHAFRHSFATEVAKHGDISLVAELLGHASLKTSQIYIKVNDKRAKESALSFQKKGI